MALEYGPLDDETATLLDTLAADWRPFVQDDMNIVAHAIRRDAAANDGSICPNRVRLALVGKVKPQRIGITYRAMRLAGFIRTDGYDTNDGTGVQREKSGNGGKPQMQYRWLGGAA